MAKITIAFGILLIILGIVGFVETGSEHPTALIPTYFGIVFAILGFVAFKPAAKKHAMHAAAMLALLGFLGTIGGLVKSLEWLAGTPPPTPAAVISKSIMAVMCIIFVLLCVQSFIIARKNRVAKSF